jgi:predicted MPP superfamily phosphohydrolase
VDDIQGRSGRSPGFNGPDLYEAGKGLDADVPRILLAHQPRYFDEAAGRIALQLSGHTHGGQINPGFCPADLFMRFVAGRYEREGSTLWVNRGFGVAGPPSRVGAPPEVTKIVIIGA